MKVTVVTLYDGSLAEHYVGVVEGSLTKEQREALKTAYNAKLEDPGEYEEPRYLTFRELDTVQDPSKLGDLVNISDENDGT